MSVRDRQFVKFAVTFIVLSIAAMALIVYLAEHHAFSGASAVASGLAIMGLILLLGPVGVIVAGYLAWIITGQSRAFPHSGFAYRLPLFAVLAIAIWYGFNYLSNGFGVAFETVMYFPAGAALLGALVAASVSFSKRIVHTAQ
jgi:hypothetical protein